MRRPAPRAPRSALAVALGVLTLAAPTLVPRPLGAQAGGAGTTAAATERGHERGFPRRYLYAALGGTLGLGLSQLYKSGNSYSGTCTSGSCVTIVSTAGGVFLGYLIGRESDELHGLRYRSGAPLSPPFVSASLGGEPLAVAARDSLVAVAGASGVDLFSSARAALGVAGRRAAGVRSIAGVELVPRSGQLAVASASGLYVYPPGSGPGTLLREGDVSAVVSSSDRFFVATGTRVDVLPSTADSAGAWPGVDLGRPVRALAWDAGRSLLWAAADSDLVALRVSGDSLTPIGAVRLGAPARRVAALGPRVAVALGEGGVRLFDVSDAARPVERMHWTGARFAYDVALSSTRLFVAAGGDGLFVLDANAGSRPVIGLARNLGFAVGIVARGDYAYVLDREGRALRRIPTAF